MPDVDMAGQKWAPFGHRDIAKVDKMAYKRGIVTRCVKLTERMFDVI